MYYFLTLQCQRGATVNTDPFGIKWDQLQRSPITLQRLYCRGIFWQSCRVGHGIPVGFPQDWNHDHSVSCDRDTQQKSDDFFLCLPWMMVGRSHQKRAWCVYIADWWSKCAATETQMLSMESLSTKHKMRTRWDPSNSSWIGMGQGCFCGMGLKRKSTAVSSSSLLLSVIYSD